MTEILNGVHQGRANTAIIPFHSSALPELGATHSHICQAHWDEWDKGSGVNGTIIRLNVRTLSDGGEIASRLGWKGYHHTPGWWCSGVNPRTGSPMGTVHGQFKPDSPIQFPEKEKPAKYLTPKADYDAVCLDTGDQDYWPRIVSDPSIPLVITEGCKKAGAGLSIGIPTLALIGVEMGLRNGGLVDSLKPFAVPGRTFNLAFDADIIVKPEVQKALRRLAKALLVNGCIVKVVQWKLKQGKGMDDYIIANGERAFKQCIAVAAAIEKWEKQFKSNKADKGQGRRLGAGDKLPPADEIAKEIASSYRERLLFNNQTARWMRYQADVPGVWSPETEEFMESIVSGILDGMGICGYGSNAYVVNILKKMRHLLIERKWNERAANDLLPFLNGVVDLATGQLLPHSPSYRFTWCLPRHHDPLAIDWSQIDAFLDHATGGNQALKEMLLCYANAVLKGRCDLQKCLHLIGVGGSGKGTYLRLLVDLIGGQNVHSSTLEDWCSNRFEAANAYRKRLVVFWDEDKGQRQLGRFKSLTGGDWLRGEEKGEKAFQFKYDGMVAVCSNFPIFSGDGSSGLARRLLVVPFNATTSAGGRRNLNRDFQPELAAFTNYVLSIPDFRVTEVLGGGDPIPEVSQEFWESRIRTDSIAAWLNDRVVRDPMARTPVGNSHEDSESLYGSYVRYCRDNGHSNIKANKNFSPDLLELCRSILGWTEIEKVATKTGKFIRGLRLRRAGDDDHIPTYDYSLLQLARGGDGSSDGSGDGSGDGSQSNHSEQLTNGDGLIVSRIEILESEIISLEESSPSNFVKGIAADVSPPVKNDSGVGFDPSPPPVSTSVTASVTAEVTAVEADSWLDPSNLQDMAKTLMSCDFSMLAELRSAWPAHAVNAACKLLPLEARQRIESWAKQLYRQAGPLQPGKRVKVGNHYGELRASTSNNLWMIRWDNQPASTLKMYGTPPAGAIEPERIELVE